MTIDTILCPVDFSDASQRALACARAIAEEYRARLIVLHVAQPAQVLTGALPDGGFFADEVSVDVAALRRRLRQNLPVKAGSRAFVDAEVIIGSPADAITSYAAAARPDLIVMGTRGTSGLRHLVLGSVTEDVLRSVDCPVLAIPPDADPAPPFPFRRVVCATDFSATSVGALRLAASLSRDAITSVTVLHVVDDVDENELFVARPYDVHRHPGERDTRTLEALRDLTGRAFGGQRQPEVRIACGSADEEILAAAAAMRADLIVMGVRGHNPLRARLFGSTTNSVVRRAACPVLTSHG